MLQADTVHLSYMVPAPRAGLRRRAWLAAGAVLGLGLVAGCASKPVTTPVTLQFVAAADVNPDARGRASPVLARVYALKAPGAFDTADFFSLQDKDSATLGADLVQREELVLRPGEHKSLQFVLPADVAALGFIGAYRDLNRARWRQGVAVTPGAPLALVVTYGAQGISVARR